MADICVLAHSDEMYEIAQKFVRSYDCSISIIRVDSYDEALQKARTQAAGTKVLIARGGYAAALYSSNISIPILSISSVGNTLTYLVISAIRSGTRFAAIGNPELVQLVSQVASLLDISIPCFTVSRQEDFPVYVEQAKRMGNQAILGGYDATKYAQEADLECFTLRVTESDMKYSLDMAFRIVQPLTTEERQHYILQTMIDTISEGMLLVERSGKVTQLNSNAKRILGVINSSNLGTKLFLNHMPLNKVLASIHSMQDAIIDEITEISQRQYTYSILPVSLKKDASHYIIILREIEYISALEQKIRMTSYQRGFSAKYTFEDIIGESAPLQTAIDTAKTYSVTDISILIQGESGVGKELFAQSIHNNSLRKNQPFVAVNCAALPSDLLESELFGYVRGAFTGARKEGKAGLLEMAHGGTIFLDEISEACQKVQSRLLRVLEEKQVMRIGDDKIIPIDIRVIAASNKNLKRLADTAQFRKDLYYRISTLSVLIPPLRNRKEDIPALVRYFAGMNTDAGSPTPQISVTGMESLTGYNWPGNVRELRNVVTRLCILYKDKIIDAEDVVSSLDISSGFDLDEPALRDSGRIRVSNKANEFSSIRQALKEANGNKVLAARLLGISRQTLYKKLREMEAFDREDKLNP